jgi:predicted enzyme related to lactoylglutathione lyase
MKLSKNVPIVTTKKLAEVKQFYLEHFGFETTFANDQYLGLRSAGDGAIELGFMVPCDQNEPEYTGRGITFGMEVEDVDAEHERLSGRGLEVVRPLQDNPWGDRSFVVMDPAGVALYINKPIAPSAEFEQYVTG